VYSSFYIIIKIMEIKKTIIIVDDNEPTRALLRGVLENAGYAVIESGDGEAAVSMAKDEKPDAAIIDQYMEPYNGYKVAEMMKYQKVEIPMIMITAHDATDLFLQAQKHGFSNVMKKPIDPERLLWILSRELR
tara:strand:- start:170 stop:568 length:399 start_codon:yes stop_codon:yes gene_type:complete